MRLRLPATLRSSGLCDREVLAYSCWAVAAFHRASRTFHQPTTSFVILTFEKKSARPRGKIARTLAANRPRSQRVAKDFRALIRDMVRPAPVLSAGSRNPGIVVGLPSRPIQIGGEPCRSPGSRINGTKLPSQRLRASGLRVSFLTAYSGGAAPDFHRLPNLHRVARFIQQLRETRKDARRAEGSGVDASR
jgi:hypothetical protein